MLSKFYSIDKDKQLRIINACLYEFSENGYDKASTNEIVKDAQISKGLLFHYFRNKRELYLFLYEYALNLFTTEFYQNIDFSEKDLMKRIRQAVKNKMLLAKKYPLIFKFLEQAYFEESKAVKEDLIEKNKEIEHVAYRIFGDIAYSKFKEEIDVKLALNIIIWTIKGYSAQFLRDNDLDLMKNKHEEILQDIEKYIEIFIKMFYEEE